MCDPVTLAVASFGLQAGGAFMQHQQASQAAKMQTRIHEINQRNAINAANESYAAIGARAQQEQQAAADAIQRRIMEAQAAEASAFVASRENGVTGITVSHLLNNIQAQAGRDITNIRQNRDWSLDQLNRESQGVRSQAISRMNSTSPGIKPSKWATAFQLGQAGLNAYNQYDTHKYRQEQANR